MDEHRVILMNGLVSQVVIEGAIYMFKEPSYRLLSLSDRRALLAHCILDENKEVVHKLSEEELAKVRENLYKSRGYEMRKEGEEQTQSWKRMNIMLLSLCRIFKWWKIEELVEYPLSKLKVIIATTGYVTWGKKLKKSAWRYCSNFEEAKKAMHRMVIGH